MSLSHGRNQQIRGVFIALALSSTMAVAQQPTSGRAASSGAVDGFVSDTALIPLADVTVSILGSNIHVVTGTNGRFRILDLTPGRHFLLVRRLGYEPASTELELNEGDTLRASFALERVATALDTVVVAGKQVPPRLAEFEDRRRNHQATASFNRDDILKVNPVDSWQMLSRVSAIKMMPNGANGGLFAMSGRGMKVGRAAAVPCFMSVIVDGVLVRGPEQTVTLPNGVVVSLGTPFDLANLPPPDQIHGIEVFGGPASIPPQYNGAASDKMCGLIAIWTR